MRRIDAGRNRRGRWPVAGGRRPVCAPPPDLPGLSEFGRLRGRPRLPPRLRLDRRHRPFH